jgi:DnaK suppressor protein
MDIMETRYDELKRMLLSRQREMQSELPGEPQNDLELVLVQMKAATLNKIDEALVRLDEHHYGDCFECGKEIDRLRLRALPFAVRCKDCEDAVEMAEQRVRVRSQRPSSALGFDIHG